MVEREKNIPNIDLTDFIRNPDSESARQSCVEIANALCDYGSFIIKDPRVNEEHNNVFLSMMENYFMQEDSLKYEDERPDLAYQVGVTPAFRETPNYNVDCQDLEFVENLLESQKPLLPQGPDPKWRFFWRIGERAKSTEFEELNAAPVIPKAFPHWKKTMDTWGKLLSLSADTVAQMAALGLSLPQDAFTSMAECGSRLLAPTGSDLDAHGLKGTVLAGFHSDLNFLSLHGKSRFPGLHIWTRDGQKLLARVPDGCLFVQAGQQIEYCTGGIIRAGYHEVAVVDETVASVKRAREKHQSLWRISSTLFYHLASDVTMQPHPLLLNAISTRSQAEADSILTRYPPIKTGTQVQRELTKIKLKAPTVSSAPLTQ